MTTKRRTYDAGTVDKYLLAHKTALESTIDLLDGKIVDTESTRELRMVWYVQQEMLEHQLSEVKHMIKKIQHHAPEGTTEIEIEAWPAVGGDQS